MWTGWAEVGLGSSHHCWIKDRIGENWVSRVKAGLAGAACKCALMEICQRFGEQA